MTAFLAGLALGLAGSAHCAGMCGPLVLTFGRRPAPGSRLDGPLHALAYHSGRLLTYVALALPAGLAGQALVLSGLGRVLAIAAAALLLAAAAASLQTRQGPLLRPSRASRADGRPFRRLVAACMDLPRRLGSVAGAAAARACGAAHRWSRAHAVAGPLVTGAANGLIPCGLVYAAVTAAAATGAAREAVLLMLGFGAGTTPALMAMSLSAASIPAAWRPRLRRLTPIVLALTAALLLLRGVTSSSTPHHHPSSPAASHH